MAKKLFLYHLKQDVNNSYDTYDSAVVVAASEEEARHTHPSQWSKDYNEDTWAKPKQVTVTLLGVARKELMKGVVCSSFSAG